MPKCDSCDKIVDFTILVTNKYLMDQQMCFNCLKDKLKME